MLWKCKKSLKNKKIFGKIRLLFLWKLIYNFIMIWKGVAFFMEQRINAVSFWENLWTWNAE
ncbi:hypothetical protein ADH70_002205 [Blautia pseudococcoides]|uniref:Uncharacterized protein n=1 Tax=Blautia pseudococcoides TaxID=1796616 RepID=A0A1C7I9R2_9FIRM|nr:hypothetical protein A4V09_03870 [Blautia pseudococcoides]ASU27782.1 hypothetical protein ADH70_002205 [Blautia pseudococcoides]